MNVSIERFLAPLCDTLISDTIALKYYYKNITPISELCIQWEITYKYTL